MPNSAATGAAFALSLLLSATRANTPRPPAAARKPPSARLSDLSHSHQRKGMYHMRCDNERCESNKDGYCEIPSNYIQLDDNGVCTNMMLRPVQNENE